MGRVSWEVLVIILVAVSAYAGVMDIYVDCEAKTSWTSCL